MYLVGSPVHTWKAGTVTISSVSKPPTQQSQRESLPVRKTLFLYHLNFKPSKWHLVFMTYCMWVISTLMLLLNTTWFIMPKEPQWQITAVCKITEIFTNTVFFFFFFFFKWLVAAKRFVKSNCQNIKLYNQWVKHHVGILRWAADVAVTEMSRCVTGTRTIVRFLIIHQMSHCSLRYIDWMTGWLESPTYIYSSLRSEIILNSVVLPAACVSLPAPPPPPC